MVTPVFWRSRFNVNTTTAGDQDSVRIEALKNGTFAAVWRDTSETGADPDFNAIRGQIFNADGSKKGAEFVVNSTIKSDQVTPAVAVMNDGRFVVTWRDDSQFNDIGSDGDVIRSDIRARVFDPNGTPAGGDFHVNTITGQQQEFPSVAALSNGGFVISYASGDSVLSQAYGPGLNPLGGEVIANTASGGSQTPLNVIGLGGNYAVFYADDSQSFDDLSDLTILGHILSPTGQEIGSEFLVPEPGAGIRTLPTAAAFTSGRFVVTWTSQFGDNSGTSIKAQIFNSDGTKVGAEILANEITRHDQDNASVVALADGGFALSYNSVIPSGNESTRGQSSVYLATFDGNGNRTGADLLVGSFARDFAAKTDLAVLADGRIVVSWDDFVNSSTDLFGIFAQIVDPRQKAVSLAGTAGDDQYVGTGFNDSLHGNTGNDILAGALGKDLLWGEKGKDTFVFDSALNKKTNVDTIKDFNVKDDTFNLSKAIFSKIAKTGVLKKDAFFKGVKAHDKSDRIIYNDKKGAIFYDADGSGHKAAVQFASLKKHLKITEKDFFIV